MPKKQNEYTRSISDILRDNQLSQFDFFEESSEPTFKMISVEKIELNELYKYRKINNDELNKVISSIQEFGIITPIIVRIKENDTYDLITGIKRLEAAKELNISLIPSVVLNINKEQMMMILVDETINSENTNPLEKAYTYQYMAQELKLTQTEIAQKVGKSRPYITNHLRLLSLPSKVKKMIIQGLLTFGQARPLVSLPKEEAINLANRIVKEKLSAREIENYAALILSNRFNNQHDNLLLKELSTKLNCNVKIKKNKLILESNEIDDLIRLLNNLLNEGGNEDAI